jgi:hypothetical protein
LLFFRGQRGDKEFVLKCVSVPGYGELFQYASEALRNDREVLLAALAAYPPNSSNAVLCFTSSDVLDDDEIAQLALKACAVNFYYMSERLRANKELVVAACVASYGYVG